MRACQSEYYLFFTHNYPNLASLLFVHLLSDIVFYFYGFHMHACALNTIQVPKFASASLVGKCSTPPPDVKLCGLNTYARDYTINSGGNSTTRMCVAFQML